MKGIWNKNKSKPLCECNNDELYLACGNRPEIFFAKFFCISRQLSSCLYLNVMCDFAGAQRTVHVLHNSEQPASVFAILESGSKVVPLIADGLFDLLMLKMTNIYTSKKQTKIESKGPRFEIGDFCVKLGSVTMSQNFKGVLVEVRATIYIALEKKRDSPKATKIRPSVANFFDPRNFQLFLQQMVFRLAPTWQIIVTFNSEIHFARKKFTFGNYSSTI